MFIKIVLWNVYDNRCTKFAGQYIKNIKIRIEGVSNSSIWQSLSFLEGVKKHAEAHLKDCDVTALRKSKGWSTIRFPEETSLLWQGRSCNRRAKHPSRQRHDRYDNVSECSSPEEGPEGVWGGERRARCICGFLRSIVFTLRGYDVVWTSDLPLLGGKRTPKGSSQAGVPRSRISWSRFKILSLSREEKKIMYE